MLNRLFHFLKGYVIIEVCGSDLERFINICIRRNINLQQLEHLEENKIKLQILKDDFFKIRPIVYKTHSKVKILKKFGLYDLKNRYYNRYTFFAGIAAAVFLFALSSQYIWLVEINGVYDSDYGKLTEILKENGVYVGAKKKNVKESYIIKQNIINNTDDISWAWVYIEGAKARVEINEKILPSIPLPEDTPCDIVAAKDGFVESITTIKGHDLVPSGTAVSQGDVLISGKVPVFKQYEEEKYIYVPAQGTVRATTVHTKSGVYPLNHESRIPTGREKHYISVELFGKLFKLFKTDVPSYENYDEKSERHELSLPIFGYSGICINVKTCTEVTCFLEPMMYETAVEAGKNDLEEKITKELLKNPQLVDEKVESEKIDNTSVKVTLEMTVVEDIGVKQPLNMN